MTETGEYKVILNTADGEEFAGAGRYWSTEQVFTFTVKDGKPTIDAAKNATFVKGVQADLTNFFEIWNLGDDLTVTYAADGDPLTDSLFTPTADSHEITVTAADLYGTTTKTFTVPAVSILEQERVEASGFYGQAITLPLPVVPDGTQYTLCVYDENDNAVTTSVSHVFAKGGTYTVEYTFTVFGSSVPVTKECTFVLTLEAVAPNIVVSGSYETSYFAGKKLTILSATATDGSEQFTVNTEAFLNGDKVNVSDNALTLSVGQYEIVYFTTYGDNQRAETRRSFTVIADTVAPVIIVDGAYAAEYAAGNVVSVLDAGVSDNSGETLSYTVEITRGKKTVEPTNGEIKLEKGDYKIVYRATDLAGNTAEKVFEFKVTGSGCACNGEIGGELWLAALLLPVAAAWMIMRRKKHEDQK